MSLPLLPAFRRQQLVLDFSSLKDHCPEGLYLSLTPGDTSLWAAVLFVRKGPYEEAILRFQISFSDTYPESPPLITFSSDVFHPLVVPLTTYTFSAGAVDASNRAGSAEENRLPPGAFSLRYGFPSWFSPGRGQADDIESSSVTAPGDEGAPSTPTGSDRHSDPATEKDKKRLDTTDRRALILNVIVHVQEAFESEDLLDKIPLEAAGDPSAWHAWRAYRGISRKEQKTSGASAQGAMPSSPKNPGEWKWDGVWESRVRNGVEASISEAALFGSTSNTFRPGNLNADLTTMDSRQRSLAAADRQIRFSKISDEKYEELKNQISVAASLAPTT